MANKSLAEACVAFADAVAITVGETGRDSALTDQLLRASGGMGYHATEASERTVKQDAVSEWRDACRDCREAVYWLALCGKAGMFPEPSFLRLEKRGRTLQRRLKVTAEKADERHQNYLFKRSGITVLTTLRLLLRGWRAEDADALMQLSDEEYQTSGLPLFDTEEKAALCIASWREDSSVFAVCHQGENRVLGYAGFLTDGINKQRKRLIVAIGEAYRRRGYASELIEALLDYGFQVADASVIVAELYTPILCRTLLRFGFVEEGVRCCYGYGGCDTEWYAMTKEMWKELP